MLQPLISNISRASQHPPPDRHPRWNKRILGCRHRRNHNPNRVGDLPCGPLCAGAHLAPLPGLPLQIAEPLPYQCISEGAIGPEDSHWSTAGHAPLLGGLRSTVSTLSLTAYLSTRDGSRALRGAYHQWAGASARFAARIWDLGKRGIAQNGRKVRHLWELGPAIAWRISRHR